MEPVPGKLRWRCRRGTRELDSILEGFLNTTYSSLDPSAREAFAQLLECEDDQLWDWLSGRIPCENPQLESIVSVILSRH